MKKIYLFGLLALGMLAFSSCNDDNDELTDSRLTYYADLQMEGDEFMTVPVGSTFVDPGCKGTLAGEDITNDIKIVGADDVDPNTVGFYYITYSAVGSDGYPASVERTVCVYDPSVTTDISGDYTVQEGSYRYWFSSGATVMFSGYPVIIEQVVPGIFSISDMMGGYYDVRAGYGPRYAMSGYIQLTGDNEILALSGIVPGWGDSYDELYDGSYDPETQTVTFDIDYAGSMQFHIILK
ncbi:MAG: DUF5012 domain-containing protein [Muribaculaceae bacterium]|nr:DUF5012 domain-containing protein [Muribaculaceae bacterium]